MLPPEDISPPMTNRLKVKIKDDTPSNCQSKESNKATLRFKTKRVMKEKKWIVPNHKGEK